METKKVLAIIFSVLFLGAFAFVLSWGIINFNKVQDAMSGTQIYDAEDLDKAYNDGYNTALTNKEEYDTLINSYRDNITSLTDNISQLNSQITSLTNNNKDYQAQVENLNNQKSNLLAEIDSLNNNKAENEEAIKSLNNQVNNLNDKISELNKTITVNENTISSLNTQIVGLNTQIANLNQTISNNENVIKNLRLEINTLNNEIVRLTNNLNTNEDTINSLYNQIDSLNDQITSLTSLNEMYISNIEELESQVAVLTNEKNNLVIENTNYYNTISSLNNQYLSLQNINAQLENTNNLHQNTITNLNLQIASLNEQIKDITLQGQTNNLTINNLNNKINELQESITYYENYIASLETGEQVIATFEFDGSVYSIQVVNRGAKLSIVTPEDTQYKQFNGWNVNGERVDLNEFVVQTNVKLVADITYSYDVKFIVDETTVNSQIVSHNNIPTAVSSPSKEGYEFDGWSIDGVNVLDINSFNVTSNVTFVAVFTKLHSVSFVYESETKSSQTIRNGECAENVIVDNTLYKIFNGWKVNNSIVDISKYKITENTVFTADITYRYDVKYMVDDSVYNSQIVTKNQYPELPANPAKAGYQFDGWSINGKDIVNSSAILITGNTTYTAVFTKLHTATFEVDGQIVSSQTIRNNSSAVIPAVTSTAYKVFNGWKVDGVIVDISNYKITNNTHFVADFVHKFDVVFKVDNEQYNAQLVAKDSYPNMPTNPTKAGYEFDGWTLDGSTVVNANTVKINNHTTYIAKFTKLFNVQFKYENNVVSNQTVRNNEFATLPNTESTVHKVFNGWKVDDVIVNIEGYAITKDIVFVADITYKYDVNFIVEGTTYNSQLITAGEYPTLPTDPTKAEYNFVGWALTGKKVVDVTNISVNQHLQFTAIFENATYATIKGLQPSYYHNVEDRTYLVSFDSPKASYYVDYDAEEAVQLLTDIRIYYFYTTVHNDIIVCGDNGVSLFNIDTRTLNLVDGITSTSFKYFTELDNGDVLMTTTSNTPGTCLYDATTRQISKVYDKGCGQYRISNIINGEYYLSGSSSWTGLMKYNPTTHVFTSLVDDTAYKSYYVLKNGDTLISAEGVYLYEQSTGTVKQLYSSGTYWTNYCIELDNGNIILGTSNVYTSSSSSSSYGLLLYDINTKTISQIYAYGGGWTKSYIKTKTGGYLFYGEWSSQSSQAPYGVISYNPTTNKVTKIVNTSSYRFFTEELSSGDIVISSNDSKNPGFYVFDPVKNSLKTISTGSTTYHKANCVEFSNNKVLISPSYINYTWYYDTEKDTFTTSYIDSGIEIGYELGNGKAIISDNTQSCYLFDLETGQYSTLTMSDIQCRYSDFYQLSNGKVFTSSEVYQQGLYLMDIETKTYEQVCDFGVSWSNFIELSNGKVLISSSDKSTTGLYVYDINTKEFKEILSGYYDWNVMEVIDGGVRLSSTNIIATPTIIYSLETGDIL